MVHISEEGELLEISGNLLEIGADITVLMTAAMMAIGENGGGKEEAADYIETILGAVIGTIEDEEIREGMLEGIREVGSYSKEDIDIISFKRYEENGIGMSS